MKALSVRQPWAHLIIHHGKDIENRTWATKYRCPLLIHAGKTIDSYAYEIKLIQSDLQLGQCVGIVDLIDCVTDSDSKWFDGPFGFVLANPRPIKPFPYKGQLGFFEVPDHFIEIPA